MLSRLSISVLIIAALMAACSGPSLPSAFAPAGDVASQAQGSSSGVALDLNRSKRLLAVGPSRAVTLAWAKEHPLLIRRAFRENGGSYLWVADGRGAIWQTKAGNSAQRIGRQVVGALLDCATPLGIKVDHHGNLWSACSSTGTVNMYAPKATSATLTLETNMTQGSTTVRSEPNDVAFDEAGDVYISNELTLTFIGQNAPTPTFGVVDVYRAKCGGLPCNKATPDEVLVDPNINPQCTPPKNGYCGTAYGYAFLDIDSAGSVYEDYTIHVERCKKSCQVTYVRVGTDRISNPLSSPSYRTIIGGMEVPGGVYTTSHGTILNVLDEKTDLVRKYTLNPFRRIGFYGPTPQSQLHDCQPVAIGFSSSEMQIAAGDVNCHALMAGDTATNKFFSHLNLDYGLLAGAAFEPSDK
jgi:hypothetical protein